MAFYNPSYSFPYDNGAYYHQIPYETDFYDPSPYPYSDYSYYPPNQSSANFYSYEFQPSQSLIAYSPCDDVAYANPGSIHYSVYHSIAAPPLDDDLNFADYDLHPYKGGYDIDQTYGKPLPPSDQICYPPSSISLNLPTPLTIVPVAQEQEDDDDDDDDDDEDYEEEEEELPKKEEAKDLRIEAPVPEEEEDSDGSDEESEESEDSDSVQVSEVVEESNYGKVVDQMPPGYGLEAYDLCENLFGYWPCLSKMKKKCGECGNEIRVNYGGNDVDEWKRAADYFFGNPDPYKGSIDQGGYPSANTGYGYDLLQYQYQPSSAVVMYEQPHQYAQNSWFL